MRRQSNDNLHPASSPVRVRGSQSRLTPAVHKSEFEHSRSHVNVKVAVINHRYATAPWAARFRQTSQGSFLHEDLIVDGDHMLSAIITAGSIASRADALPLKHPTPVGRCQAGIFELISPSRGYVRAQGPVHRQRLSHRVTLVKCAATAAATEVPINCRRVYRSGLSHYRRRPGGAAGIARAVIGIIGQIPFAQHAIAEGTC